MHELSIAENIVCIVREEMIKHNASVLSSLRLAVGKMSGVVPDSLSFCLELIIKETDLRGAKIVIDIIPLKAECGKCQEVVELSHYTATCPLCGSDKIIIVSGRELSIVELEVED